MSNSQIIIMIGLMGTCFIIGTLFSRLKLRKRMLKLIEYNRNINRANEYYKHQLNSLINTREANLMFLTDQEIEKERLRIAKDLHDDVGSDLTQLSMGFDWVNNHPDLPGGLTLRLVILKKLAKKSLEGLRAVTWNITPEGLIESGLSHALQELCKTRELTKGIHIHFQEVGIPWKPSLHYELSLFRMVKELIANTMKHSNAWNLWISLWWEHDKIILEVEDDGKKFRNETISKSVKHRAKLLNAKVEKLNTTVGLRIRISVWNVYSGLSE